MDVDYELRRRKPAVIAEGGPRKGITRDVAPFEHDGHRDGGGGDGDEAVGPADHGGDRKSEVMENLEDYLVADEEYDDGSYEVCQNIDSASAHHRHMRNKK